MDRTGAQTMLYLTCTMISSVDLAHYEVSRAKDWVSEACGTTFTDSLHQVSLTIKCHTFKKSKTGSRNVHWLIS